MGVFLLAYFATSSMDLMSLVLRPRRGYLILRFATFIVCFYTKKWHGYSVGRLTFLFSPSQSRITGGLVKLERGEENLSKVS